MKRVKHYLTIQFLGIAFIILFLAPGCSKDKDTVKTGSAMISFGNGFDFSTESEIDLEESSGENFTSEVDKIDIYFNADQAPSTPGNPPAPFEFSLIGSPKGNIYMDDMIIAYQVLPDNSVPAIKILDQTSIKQVNKISKDGFQLTINSLSTNRVYAVITQDLHYAIFEVTHIDTLSDFTNLSFQWKYNSDGGRTF